MGHTIPLKIIVLLTDVFIPFALTITLRRSVSPGRPYL